MSLRSHGNGQIGSALAIVLVTTAVLLIVVAELSSRTMREFRVMNARSASDQAYFAAEAGFSRVRAQISMKGVPDDAVSGSTEWIQAFPADPDGTALRASDDPTSEVMGYYLVKIRQPDLNVKQWRVVSTGWDAAQRAKRVVSGTITVKSASPDRTIRLSPLLKVYTLIVSLDDP